MAFFSSAAGALLRRRAAAAAPLLRYLSSSSSSSSAAPIDAGGYHLSGGPSHMRAAVFWGGGNTSLTIEDFQMPRPKAGEILVKTKACGVCHSELHVMKAGVFPTPCVLGHEITGEVVEHGAHTDSRVMKRLPIGSRVVGAYILPCGNCFYCVKGEEDLCEVFNECNRANGTLYDGETRLFLRDGKPVSMFCMSGLSEYCVVPATALATIPDSLPFSESAILGCAVFTAYGAMRNAAQMRSGDSVAVIGVGGVGSSCLQIARAFGAAEIIAVDISDEKLTNALKCGATHTVNSLKEDVVAKIKEITGGRGVDIGVEVLGRPTTFMQCLKSVRDGGKAVMVGLNSSGEPGEVDITRLVRREIKIIGSYGARPRQDLPHIVKLAESGAFNIQNAVSRKCKLEETNDVYADLKEGKILGRAVIEMS